MALCGRTTGGKGNIGRFIERQPQICAAGLTSSQPEQNVADCLQHYLLQEEVDALISDAIIPPPKPRPLPPRRNKVADPIGLGSELINPKPKNKIQILAEDLKETTYASYFKRPLGTFRDPVPFLPAGFDFTQTLGKKWERDEFNAFELLFPRDPVPGQVPISKTAGEQTSRNYCVPPFKPTGLYGERSGTDREGKLVPCCLTDDRQLLGTGLKVVLSSKSADYQAANVPRVGKVLKPIDNAKFLPEGYIFGVKYHTHDITKCMCTCELDPEAIFYKECLANINSLKKILGRRFQPKFYRDLYLHLKSYDTDNSGWLPKQKIYDHCTTLHIRLTPHLLEPLLEMWNALDGSRIEYKTFVRVLNHKEPLPGLRKLRFIPPNCMYYDTEYRMMSNLCQEVDHRPEAGIGTSFPLMPDSYCRADKDSTPMENTVKSCISPSALTHTTVTHRDMFARREPAQVRRVFEAAGISFTDEEFDAAWKDAQKQHSQGFVCYETFRRAMETTAAAK